MKSITYINEIYTRTEVDLSYKNNEENPVEIIVEVPMRSEIIFSKLIIKIKDKIIEAKVIESTRAEEKYNDAISSGNTGIASSYDINKKVCSLKIGNLPPKETLTLNYSFIQFINIKDSFYYLNLIKDFPSINNFNSEILKGKIIIETSSAINDLQCLTDSNKLINYNPVYSKENKKCEIEYDIKLLNKILFKTLNIEKPLFISQYNNKLDETNYILNYYNNMSNPDKIKYPCLFIFLIDQSGSMTNTINNVKITLTKLIQSLPNNSYYQIIGFGSRYEVYNKSPEQNNEENLKNAYKIINDLSANLGGTDLSLPLNYILKYSYSEYKDISLSKQIIVLTDGDINIGEDIIELIKLHNNEFLIHFIGIGNEVNKKLIIEASKSGNGTYYFINDSLNELDEIIFEILNNCTKEYINNYKFILDENKSFELNPINKTTYNKESLKYCFILKGKEKNENINIKFNYENLKEKLEKEIKCYYNDIIKLPEGEDLSKLIIGLALRYDLIKDKNEKIKLSKLYQVLCDLTTLFAEIEGEKAIQNKMVTFTKNYSIKRLENYGFAYRACPYNSVKERFRSVSKIRASSPGFKYKYDFKKKQFNIFSLKEFWICSILIIAFISYLIMKFIK